MSDAVVGARLVDEVDAAGQILKRNAVLELLKLMEARMVGANHVGFA